MGNEPSAAWKFLDSDLPPPLTVKVKVPLFCIVNFRQVVLLFEFWGGFTHRMPRREQDLEEVIVGKQTDKKSQHLFAF